VEKYALEELKLIYRVLHGSLMENVALLDAHFFTDLQTYLHRRAQAEGVDVGDHGAWDVWLGNEAVGCAVRLEKRVSLN